MQRLTHVCASCRRTVVTPSIRWATRRAIQSSSAGSDGNESNNGGDTRNPWIRFLGGQGQPVPSRTPKPPKWSKRPENQSIERKRSNLLSKSKKPRPGDEFHQVDPTGDLKIEIKKISESLSRDGGKVGVVFESLRHLLSRNPLRRDSIRGPLRDNDIMWKIVHALLLYRNKVPDLPTFSEVLRTFAEHGLNQDELWGDVMFEYIREEDFDLVLELWSDRLRCKRRFPEAFMGSQDHKITHVGGPTSHPMREGPSKSIKYPPRCYPAVAALTAFLYSQRLLIIQPQLIAVLRFLDPTGRDFGDLPSTLGIGGILHEYQVDARLVATTLGDITSTRSHSGLSSDHHRALYDQIHFISSSKDLEGLRQTYIAAKATLPDADKSLTYFISFLSGFMECKSSVDAEGVWNDMLLAGHMPSTKVWASWLDGCAKAGDVKMFSDGWNRMLRDKIAPDTICWTIRMQLHFMMEDPEAAKACLQSMLDKQLPITTYALNVAIKGITTAGLHRDAAELVNWATDTGLNLDSYSFNLILDARAKLNDFSGVLALLRKMKERGNHPDTVTYAIIVRGLYQHSKVSPSMEVIEGIIQNMKNENVHTNLHFYNTIIQGMLGRFSDINGAIRILSLMPNDSWRGSSHTSAIFIKYYGIAGNPDAIDEIWKNIERNKLVPDEAVYRVTVAAYARSGRLEQMIGYLHLMKERRKRPNSFVWAACIHAFIDKGDFEGAKEVFKMMHADGYDMRNNSELIRLAERVKIGLDPNAAMTMYR